MQASKEIVFLQGGLGSEAKYAEALPSYSFPAKVCNSLHGFKRLFAVHRIFSSILIGAHADPGATVRALRRLDSRMWIIYLYPVTSSNLRIATLAAGADICLPAEVETAELAATLQALVRRARLETVGSAATRLSIDAVGPTICHDSRSAPRSIIMPTGPAADLASVTDAFARARPAVDMSDQAGWHFLQGGRRLSCRHGRSIPLTPTERIFLARLLDSADQPVHRARVYEIGTSQTDDEMSPASMQRSVDVMVSRLRRKARDNGMYLPIKAVRGWGYMFAPNAGQKSAARADDFRDIDGTDDTDTDYALRPEKECCVLARHT